VARSLHYPDLQAAPLVTPPSARVAASLIYSTARRAPLAPGCCPIWGLNSVVVLEAPRCAEACQHDGHLLHEVGQLD